MQKPTFTDTKDPHLNIADLKKGEGLIALLADLAKDGLLEWDGERGLAMVAKRTLTAKAKTTAFAQQFRAWLTSQGFKGSRRSRSYYLTLPQMEQRGVTMEDGQAKVCEAKEEAPKEVAENPFAKYMEQAS